MIEIAEPIATEGTATDSGRENSERAFLAVLAESLLDNVGRLDDTVGRVTDFVMSNRPDRDTVVRLQAFDRLKQEFEALAGALYRYAKAPGSADRAGADHLQLQQQVIAGITLADLKERLLTCMLNGLPELAAPPISPAQAAEIGIDVVY